MTPTWIDAFNLSCWDAALLLTREPRPGSVPFPVMPFSSGRVRPLHSYVSDEEFTQELDQAWRMPGDAPQLSAVSDVLPAPGLWRHLPCLCAGYPAGWWNQACYQRWEFGPHIIPYAVEQFTQACNELAQGMSQQAGDTTGSTAPLASAIAYQAGVWLRMLRTLITQREHRP